MKLTKQNIIPQGIAVGVVFQLLMIMFSSIGFAAIQFETPTRYIAVTALALLIVTIGAFGTMRFVGAKNYMKPTRFQMEIIVFGVVLAAAIGGIMWLGCKDYAQMAMVGLVTLFMPLYEGVVFRGLMWHKVKKVYNSKWKAWFAMIFIVTFAQLFYTYNIYNILVVAGEFLADPAEIVISITCYGVVVNMLLGAVRAGVHNFLVPTLIHSAVNLALMYFVIL